MKSNQKTVTPDNQQNIVPFPTKEDSLPDSLKLEAAMATLEILEENTPTPEGSAGPMGLYKVTLLAFSMMRGVQHDNV